MQIREILIIESKPIWNVPGGVSSLAERIEGGEQEYIEALTLLLVF
jgi:hypothetical protein